MNHPNSRTLTPTVRVPLDLDCQEGADLIDEVEHPDDMEQRWQAFQVRSDRSELLTCLVVSAAIWTLGALWLWRVL